MHRAEEEGERGLRLTDIGERLLIRPPSVTGVVDRLAKSGLLKTAMAANDHRAKRVTLTAAGRQKIRRVLDEMPAQVESVLGCLSGEERVQLHQLLEKLDANLEVMAGMQERATRADDAAA